MMKIAFIGLGRMGGPMASNLAGAGYNIYGYNRTRDREPVKDAERAGVKIVDSIYEAVSQAQMILTCLNDADSVRNMLFGDGSIMEHAPNNALIVDFATTGPQAAQEFSEKLAQSNLRFADCPISGGTIGAANGTLTMMFGGTEKDFQELLPLLNVVGKVVKHCGSVGSGQAVKAINQLIAAVNQVAVAEALVLSEQMGIDPNLAIDVTKTGAAGSWALENLGPKAVEGDFSPGFAIKHMLKDLGIALDNTDQELPGMTLAKSLLEKAPDVEEGTQAIIKAYRND